MKDYDEVEISSIGIAINKATTVIDILVREGVAEVEYVRTEHNKVEKVKSKNVFKPKMIARLKLTSEEVLKEK